MADVVLLGPHTRMTVNEALEYVRREGLTDVMIIGYDHDGDLMIRSSRMSRETANWMIDRAKLHVMGM